MTTTKPNLLLIRSPPVAGPLIPPIPPGHRFQLRYPGTEVAVKHIINVVLDRAKKGLVSELGGRIKAHVSELGGLVSELGGPN